MSFYSENCKKNIPKGAVWYVNPQAREQLVYTDLKNGQHYMQRNSLGFQKWAPHINLSTHSFFGEYSHFLVQPCMF